MSENEELLAQTIKRNITDFVSIMEYIRGHCELDPATRSANGRWIKAIIDRNNDVLSHAGFPNECLPISASTNLPQNGVADDG